MESKQSLNCGNFAEHKRTSAAITRALQKKVSSLGHKLSREAGAAGHFCRSKLDCALADFAEKEHLTPLQIVMTAHLIAGEMEKSSLLSSLLTFEESEDEADFSHL